MAARCNCCATRPISKPRGAHGEPDSPGLGLGLWIVRSIVERHAGSVSALRTAQARTRFVIKLPLAPVERGGGA